MMISFRNFIKTNPLVFLFAGLFACSSAFAQEESNFVDLGVEFTNAPATVKINGVFGVTGRVFMETNSSDVPTSESISVSIVLRDPNGIILDTHTQSWSGFDQTTNGTLKRSSPDQMLFQIAWDQSINWTDAARWTLSAELTTSSIDENTNNNTATIAFGLDVPDLRVSAETVSAVEPLSGAESDNFVPNTNYTVSGTITNYGNVPTQPGIYIPVTAQLIRVGENGDSQGVMDEETILLPKEDQFETLFPNASWNFKIGNLFLPPDVSGNFAVLVRVNQQDIPGGPAQIESNFENNTDLHPDEPFINISPTSDVNDTNAQPDLRFVTGSYSGERGSFRGLEPVHLSFAVRNSGNRPVAPGDQITAKVLLSKDLSEDDTDFVLREFNLGGGGIGKGLLAGETINLTWFQQMPDNYEGDYYLIISIDNVGDGANQLTPIDSTPIITLSSQGAGTTSVLDTSIEGTSYPAERPDASHDGRFVTYEKTLLVNGQELQQIYIIDMEQPEPEPKLISRAYSSTSFFPVPANGNSFRPKISADGTTVVFYSGATNLVPGDTNNKEDVFLYRLSTDTMFRAVIYNADGSNVQLSGRSLYPDINGDGTKIVFESDSDLNGTSSGSEIFLWSLDAKGGGSLDVITAGIGNSYNPSIDDAGKYVVFDSYATFSGQLHAGASADTNGLRDIFLMNVEDLNAKSLWRANLNFKGEQTMGGESFNPRISGEGNRIVYESKAQNLVRGAGIAKIEVIEGGYGYKGRPTVKIFDEDTNESGAYGTGAILSLKADGINLLEEIKVDAIQIINSGKGYISPRVEITHDPAYPAPLQEAKAVAYLSNPDGDVYYIDVNDTIGSNPTPSYSKRISESSSTTGGNFASRDLSISSDGKAIVYSTKSSNLLPEERVRDDGKTFYNSNYILPSAKAILVGGIGEIEIQSTGSGYTAGTLRIDDLSGTGSGAEASYRVDNRGRIVSIDILDPGQNYQLDQTIVSVSEPRGGSGFVAGTLRFEPTRGEGTTRTGGGRIFKVEMTEFGYGYKIGDDENASFAEIIQFEGDGADLNEDGFPDGRINPDRVKNIGGSLFLEQRFDVEVLSLNEDLLNTTLSISDKNNSLEPVTIKFSENAGAATTINITGKESSKIRDEIISIIVNHLGENLLGNQDIEVGPVIDNNLTGSNKFTFSALSGSFVSSNPSAIKVTELSNMLVMGSGYTTATPVINQVPNIFGFSETKEDQSGAIGSEDDELATGRVALLSKEDFESDDIYLYYVDEPNKGQNIRVSTSSFGMPVGYRANNSIQTTALSNRFPVISGNGRYVFFSSDAWGNAGLAFSSSNQQPLDYSSTRDIYLRDLKTNTSSLPNSELELLYPRSGIDAFAPNSSIPVIADLDHTGSVSRVSMILNQTDLGSMTLFGGGGSTSDYDSGRYTAVIPNLQSGEYSLQLVAYGFNNEILATSPINRFTVSDYKGSLPPVITMANPSAFDAVTSTSVIPLSASGIDPDGALEGIQFYVDGLPYPDSDAWIPRKTGFPEESQTYSLQLDLNATTSITGETQGVRSIFVIGWDNSENYVASDIYNISFTTGSNTPEVSLSSGFSDFTIDDSMYDMNLSNDGAINGIVLHNALGENLFDASIQINHPQGSGAVLTGVFGTEPSHENFGKLTGFSIKDDEGGSGYTDINSSIQVTPIIRAINEGTPAEAGVLYAYEYNKTSLENVFLNSTVELRQNIDGSLKIGSGYVVSPRLITPPFGYIVWEGKSYERLPLSPSTKNTSSVEPFSIGPYIGFIDAAFIVGGFTQSPIIFEIDANGKGEAIESVSLVIDGETDEYLTKTTPPFNFSWVPDVVKSYAISAIVRDVAGNVITTPTNFITVDNYKGAGLNLAFQGDSDYESESNGFLPLIVEATSDSGVAVVDFFIDNMWVGSAHSESSIFQKIIDLTPLQLRQGEYDVTAIARDNNGNWAGTFSNELTNLEGRLNRKLTILPPLSKNPPEISLDAPENGITMPLGSSIRLIANASDPNGGLKGVQFYENDQSIYTWSGILEFNENNPLPSEGSLLTIDDGSGRGAYTFEFNGDSTVVAGETPILVPAYGNYLNDLSLSGGFDYPNALTFVIEIDGVSNGSDTYRWSTDGGFTFVEEKQQIISGISQTLAHGINIVFSNPTGHHLGDRWSFVAQPGNQIVEISGTDIPAIDRKRTKLRLHQAIQELYELGELSIFSQVNEYDDSIYLRHINDQAITSNVSINVDSLANIDYVPTNDNMILASVADSTLPQPFGTTWKPTEARDYIIYAMAEDFSGNRKSSGAVVITVFEPEGKVPVIELKPIASSVSFTGSPVSQTLTAEAYDPDGAIATVDFYKNAELITSDSTRPFEITFDLNATGHYELYAIARDNEGNLVTSNVEHLIVDGGGEEPNHELIVENSEVFVGGLLTVSSNFKSPSGPNNYDEDIRAMVFINGLYEGDATKMPRTPPLLGQEDPGQSFIFEKEARGVGSYEVEFLILNGNETSSATSNITISESPLTDDYLFLKSLWNGLYDRDPEPFEISKLLLGLSNGSMARAQIINELYQLDEFKKARNLFLVYKTIYGSWAKTTGQAISLGSTGGNLDQEGDQIDRPDDGDSILTATPISMNETIHGRIEVPGDIDIFKITSSGNSRNDGVLSLTLEEGHPGVGVNSWGEALDIFNYGIHAVKNDGSEDVQIRGSFGTSGWRWREGGGSERNDQEQFIYSLKSIQLVDYSYYLLVHGSPYRTGSYTLTLLNPEALEEETGNSLKQVNSEVIDADIPSILTNVSDGFEYTNQYGQIETHDPESFFNRLFRNKYEQDPNPTQSARGVNLLKDGRTQLQFLQDFALENNVVTVGGYNYTTSEAQLAIPNVPLDAAAFAETALVYSALIGEAPSNDQVALLTMTPRMAVRPLSQRAELILDMPEYAKQYGVAKPEIDFIGVQNGQSFSGGDQISVEASSLGVDDLASTVDDGEIHTVELFLNGKSMGLMTEPATGEFFYTLSLASSLTAGEYKLEAIAEDINGLRTSANRMIRVASDQSIDLEIGSPELGTTLEVGDTVEVISEIKKPIPYLERIRVGLAAGTPAAKIDYVSSVTSYVQGIITWEKPYIEVTNDDAYLDVVLPNGVTLGENNGTVYLETSSFSEPSNNPIISSASIAEPKEINGVDVVRIHIPDLRTRYLSRIEFESNVSESGYTTITNSFLEINGKVQWSAVLSLDSVETPADEHNFSISDGTGREPVTFEFDSDGLASETAVESPENIIGTGTLNLSTGEYIGTETREYIIEIDNDNEPNSISRTFRWSIDGGINFNQTEQPVDFSNVSSHPLSSGIAVTFPQSYSAYDLGDRWRVKAAPVNEIIEISKLGMIEDRIEKTRQNIIRAINRARNEGKLAIYAEDPYSNGIYKGSLPEQYVQPNSIILHHDASYPMVGEVDINISSGAPLNSTTCLDKITSPDASLSLFLGGCLEMPDPLVSLRVISSDSDGNLYYSGEKVYQVRNTKDTFAKMLKLGDVFNPGRLPTIVVSDVNESTGAISEVEILDAGSGYRELVSESHVLSAVSTSGQGAKLRAGISAAGSVNDVVSSFMGSNYKIGDMISPSPSAVFKMGEMISLDARLIGPQSQVDRVAFYANGVEIEEEVSEMIGGYYSTVFTPSDPGDYFISVRALYGDSRDIGSLNVPVAMQSNISFLNNHHQSWQNLWTQQSISGDSHYTPIWFWQHSDYWDPDLSWRTRTHWNGATPLRVIDLEDDTGEIQITLNPSSIALRAENLLDSQLTQLVVDVVRSGRTAPKLVRAYLYGNESVLAEADVPETEATSFTIPFDWEVSFLESGESVEFAVVAVDESNRKYYSDTASNTIIPLTSTNPESAVGQIYADLTGEAPSAAKISELSALVDENDTMAEVTASVLENSPNMLENLIDLVAAQHIVYGEFFESFEEFSQVSEQWIPIMNADSSEEPLKRFIDSLLSSSQYYQVFRGGIPHLVGAPTSDLLISYSQNRNQFVERHFYIKYGRYPSTLQLKQASRRMLDYWSNNHEPGYWELSSPSAAPTNEESFSGFRRDTVQSRRPTPYDAGECAVDFIYELAKEFVYPRNQAYLSYISNYVLRDSLYRPVALLYSLHRENVDASDKSVLQQAIELQGLSINQVLERITSDSNFNRRFNIIFHEDSPEVSLLATNTGNDFWKSMPWFGTFMDKEYPWIYHVDLGWLYSNGTNTENIWFYSDSLKVEDEEIGWFWTNKHVFEGPSMAGSEYDSQRFIFLLRKTNSGGQEGSWALLDISTGRVKPYGWLPLGK